MAPSTGAQDVSDRKTPRRSTSFDTRENASDSEHVRHERPQEYAPEWTLPTIGMAGFG